MLNLEASSHLKDRLAQNRNTMKLLKRVLYLICPFFFFSCASPYLKSYEPVNTFLEMENISKEKNYILRTKERNWQTLRIFNRGEGAKHVVHPNETNYNSKFFNEKQWKKLYSTYSKDTVTEHWKNRDFPGYKFVEGERRQLFTHTFSKKYPDLKDVEYVIVLSEPIYYYNRKYIMFLFAIDNYLYSSKPQIVVVMRKEGNKWVLVEKIGDYACSGCM